MEDIEYYKIPIYNFPYDDEIDDDETIEENNELRALLPFAVVGSEEEVIINGRRVRCRQYPWGVVEIDNVKHCDFSKLRYMLLSSHLQDLKEITHDILYEQYRTEKLSREGVVDLDSDLPENRLKEEQLRREEERLRERELKVRAELTARQNELLAKEEALKNLEAKLSSQTNLNNNN
eukprot:jgi/Orpsp1_1/1189354/evm.model.d7180000071353.1